MEAGGWHIEVEKGRGQGKNGGKGYWELLWGQEGGGKGIEGGGEGGEGRDSGEWDVWGGKLLK